MRQGEFDEVSTNLHWELSTREREMQKLVAGGAK